MVLNNMKRYAIVKFIGKEEDYITGKCKDNEWEYCKQCEKKTTCKEEVFPYFRKGQEYKAYFLDYCQGKRDVLEIEAENGEILSFVPLCDFEIVSDKDNVLNNNYFLVKCIEDNVKDLTKNKVYKALKENDKCYYVLDNSFDCYYYPKEYFEIYNKKQMTRFGEILEYLDFFKNCKSEEVGEVTGIGASMGWSYSEKVMGFWRALGKIRFRWNRYDILKYDKINFWKVDLDNEDLIKYSVKALVSLMQVANDWERIVDGLFHIWWENGWIVKILEILKDRDYEYNP